MAGLDLVSVQDHPYQARFVDTWTLLSVLGARTSTITLAPNVASLPLRPPVVLAKAAATLDLVTGGRVELGLGAGWYEQEHRAYAIPFPSVGERFDRLEEQLAVITGLWSAPVGETFSRAGAHFPVDASPGLPKPVQEGGVPIIVGGGGPKRTPELAARFATEFNLAFMSPQRFVEQRSRVEAACTVIDRDPASLAYSVAAVVCLGSDEAEYARRAGAIGREPDELRRHGVAGTPDEVLTALQGWADAGAERVYLQFLDLADLDHLDAVAELVGRS